MNQCQRIVKYISDFGSITTLDAFRDLGVTRLASRIHDLTKQGYTFKRDFESGKNRYGESVKYVRYSFADVDKEK